MKQFNKFYFKSFEFDNSNMQAIFHYSFDNEIFFEEIIDFSNKDFLIRADINANIIDNLLFHLHIALGISYYKTFPTKDLIIESGFLDDYQIRFWKKFYKNGLGEFLYRNKISPKGLFCFINNSDIKYIKKEFNTSNKSLVAIGGGKDSIVSIELLKQKNIDFDLITFGPKDNLLYKNTKDLSGKKRLWIKRKISKTLIDLVDKGYYNGHVPITGIIAFVLEVVSYIFDYKYIILSNEKSANYGNTSWEGLEINHQYSKSLEFEKDFGKYIDKYISSNVKYFSLLRGMYEIKIAELFSKYGKKYFSKFSSCNNNFKIFNKSENSINGKYWCNKCPKCLFVFSILSPYLNEDEIKNIFGKNLFYKKDLESLFGELLGITGIKPFECVGESEEVILSMYKNIKKYDIDNLPYILNIFKNEVLNSITESKLIKIEKKLVRIYDDDIIPKEFKSIIFKNI